MTAYSQFLSLICFHHIESLSHFYERQHWVRTAPLTWGNRAITAFINSLNDLATKAFSWMSNCFGNNRNEKPDTHLAGKMMYLFSFLSQTHTQFNIHLVKGDPNLLKLILKFEEGLLSFYYTLWQAVAAPLELWPNLHQALGADPKTALACPSSLGELQSQAPLPRRMTTGLENMWLVPFHNGAWPRSRVHHSWPDTPPCNFNKVYVRAPGTELREYSHSHYKTTKS